MGRFRCEVHRISTAPSKPQPVPAFPALKTLRPFARRPPASLRAVFFRTNDRSQRQLDSFGRP